MRRSETSRTVWASAILVLLAIAWFEVGRPGQSQRQHEASADPTPIAAVPVAPDITVSIGTPVQAPIGDFSIRVDRVAKQAASLIVSSGTKDTYRFKKAMAGQRLMIPSHDGTYYLDIKRVGGGAVTLTMGTQ